MQKRRAGQYGGIERKVCCKSVAICLKTPRSTFTGAFGGACKVFNANKLKKSGRQDLNLRPLDPQSSALAKLRHAPLKEEIVAQSDQKTMVFSPTAGFSAAGGELLPRCSLVIPPPIVYTEMFSIT